MLVYNKAVYVPAKFGLVRAKGNGVIMGDQVNRTE